MKKQRQQQKVVATGNWQQGGNNKGTNRDSIKGNAEGRNFGGPYPGGRPNEPRRQPGACYKRGDRYYPEHQCKCQLSLLEGDKEDRLEVEEGEEVEDFRKVGGEDDGEISLHALKGITNKKIIKVEGKVKKGSLSILAEAHTASLIIALPRNSSVNSQVHRLRV